MRWIAIWLVAFPILTSAETLYVRPSSAEYGAEDGTSYETAFDGFSDVTQGSGAGQLEAGDTLYVCGEHNAQFTSTVNGSAASHISIRFDCPGDPGSIDRGSTAGTVGVYINGHTYWDIYGSGDASNPDISNVENAIILNDSAGDGTTNNGGSINDVVISGCVTSSQACVFVRGTGAITDGITITNAAGDGILWIGAGQQHKNNTITNVSTGGTTGDCIQGGGGPVDGSKVGPDNYCDHSSVLSKYAYIISSSTDDGDVEIFDNTAIAATSGSCTGSPSGIYVDAVGANTQIYGNDVTGGCNGIQVADSIRAVSGNKVRSAINVGVLTGATSALDIIYNTIKSTPLGIDIGYNNAGVRAMNNIVSTTTIACIDKAGSSNVEQYNDLYSCGTDVVTHAGVTTTTGTGTITGNPAIDSNDDISSSSPAWGTGVYVYPWRGRLGKCVGSVVNIGATCANPVPYGYTLKPKARARH